MVKDALAGKIDLILTKSVSRFARNTVDTLTTVRELKEKDVEVYFEKENIFTLDAKGELLITIMSSLAQEESRSISLNTSWGRRKQFADGKVTFGYSSFLGYRMEADGKLEIIEEEAAIVRRIYDSYLLGKSAYDIAKMLTTEGVPTPMKKTNWQSTTVLSILQNVKYKGDAYLQKTFVTDFLTKKVKKNEGELPLYYIENNHPAIISADKFELVQEEFQRRKLGGQYTCISPFSGRIVCGDCGGFYGRKVWHSEEVKYRNFVWHCNNKFQKRKYCHTPSLRETAIEECFVDAFNSLLSRKAFITAWNLLVSKKLRYQASLKRTVSLSDDILLQYRAECLCQLIDNVGKIKDYDYRLALQTLERIEVTPTGKLSVYFLGGLKITL